jgi:predicted Zn-dependent protease
VAPIALVLLGTGCSAISQVNVISTEEEVQMGQNFSAEIEKELKLVTDPEVNAYVDSLGQLLAKHSDRTDIPYVIKVVDTDEVNAFAIPGGYLYVNRGLIVTATRECELAGVMGHEIGHIVGRHSAKQMSREMGVGALSSIILGNDPAAWSAMTANVLASGTLLHYGREAELEADKYGIAETYGAGIDPDGMVTFFEKLLALGESQPDFLSKLFSTHPPTGERISKGREIIASLPPKPGLSTDSPRFHAIQKRLPPIKTSAGAGGTGG